MSRSYYRSLISNEQLLLDTLSSGVAGFSLRKLRSSYTGPSIRVRRSSDNVEQDIGFDLNNNLDESALTSFIGANSAFVSIFYDQIGSNNAIQTTNANQPRIVNSGTIDRGLNSRPVIFTSGSQRLVTLNNVGISGTSVRTYLSVQHIKGSSFECAFRQQGGATGRSYSHFGRYLSTISVCDLQGSAIGPATTGNLLTSVVPSGVTNTNQIQVYRDASGPFSTVRAGSNATLNTLNTTMILCTNENFTAPSNLHEIIILNADETANLNNLHTNIKSYFSIT